MKERVLELLEELVGAHTLGQKRAKADEIAAIVKTAVFVADQFEGDPQPETAEVPLSFAPVSGVFNSGMTLVPSKAPVDAAQNMAALQQAPGDPTAENSALSVLANESPLVSHE